ncbi:MULTISPECIES: hypothetical protein [unclassified Bacillus (in: firmicutes)]|uniref:hypothetical protein n=1 Tax=unclassified Bacillus (in: firmicutes) TaxID=185979 RepID=UPI0008ECE84F|nr:MULTISPECIES: hypothetical protein [unclassified Bacillus (in: firmicutes)]SFA88108.1 hypothetical protein SAMN02799634_102292 [Bacillus sp. UNCCL13]SFQ84512.1 hypothetical protein SAMN04488577_2410 [Bacillus sp. cl95]
MLLIFLTILAIVITSLCLRLTSQNKRIRLIVGIGLTIFSIIAYPVLVPFFGEWNALEGVASLMAFHFLLFIGGIITIIAGFFTKKSRTKSGRHFPD